MAGNDGSAGRLWLVLFALTAFGLLGLVVFAGHRMAGPEQAMSCDAVLVDEAMGSDEQILARANDYLYAPGADFAAREAARIGAASKHHARRLDPQPGQELPGTQLPRTPEAIEQALEELSPGQHVHWSWNRREEDARGPGRSVLVARLDDQKYHLKVEDITCAPLEAVDEPQPAPH